ncbi:hypothetical protein ABN028_01655 [Actinopolymorpha sp. B17G11]|uniref:hypothetical protein n=1 Tax=Actinopolymorpha sp. B17G11 TaxID=3160861 RepID=UPI0032E521B8
MLTKDGNSADPPDAIEVSRALGTELRRLRQAGLADLTLRPHRYPELNATFGTGRVSPMDSVTLLAHNRRAFDDVLAALPTPAMRVAARLLFHVDSGSTPPPLNDRRRLADRAYTGRGYAREPDTVQRHLERAVLDPLLVEALIRYCPADPGETDHPPVLAPPDYESWSDDLDRAVVYLNGDAFRTTQLLLERWLNRYPLTDLDERGRHLRGRSLMLLGNMRRYQGRLFGPLSARHAYDRASDLFTQLDNQRRVAQVDLARAITVEMSGDLHASARMYQSLAEDQRLRDYERAQARLWIGTALTKAGDIASAVAEIDHASRMFEEQGEADDWGVAHQKRALAHLAAADLAGATRSIDVALSYRRADSPLEQVRLDTAHGHVLVSDPGTCTEGLAVLSRARNQATRYGLAHQLQWIERIQRIPERPGRRLQ